MNTDDHPSLPPLMHQLPPFQWEGQASPRVHLRDMEGGLFPPQWHHEATQQDRELEDWYFLSHYAALAA